MLHTFTEYVVVSYVAAWEEKEKTERTINELINLELESTETLCARTGFNV